MIKRVLFVCTGNTCRSTMAEAFLRKMLNDQLGEAGASIEVISAGTHAVDGDIASKNAQTVLASEGIDISRHRARPVSKPLLETSDLILTMTHDQKTAVLDILPSGTGKIFTLAEFTEGVSEFETLLTKADNLHQSLAEKRERFFEREGVKFEELRRRNLELSRQMRALDEELTKLEQQLELEVLLEKRELEAIQKKIKRMEISDPYGQSVDAYRYCADQIKEKLKTVLQKLKESLQ